MAKTPKPKSSGPGRPTKDVKLDQYVPINVDKPTLDRLDNYAAKNGYARSTAARQLVVKGLEQAEAGGK